MKRALLVCFVLAACSSGCIQMRVANNGSGREVPTLLMSEGMSATLRKPRGTGIVVGVVFDLDSPQGRQ